MDRWRKNTKYIPIPAKAEPRAVPEHLWIKCDECKELSYVREFEENYKVCPKCGHHARLAARERIDLLLDPESFQELFAELKPTDPLRFTADVPYPQKLSEAQRKTGLREAVVCGLGTIEQVPVVIGALDFGFMGASMGSVVGEKVACSIEEARARRWPLILVSASGGARMHEGALSLMQMAKTAAALARLGEERVPFFSLLTDPTTGGVTASFASLGDVILAEPGALIGFAGPRVIEQIIHEKLPSGFQTAEFLLEHGMIDLVVPRRELRDTFARLLRLYAPAPQPAAPVLAELPSRNSP